METSRRNFLNNTSKSALAAALLLRTRSSLAYPLHLPLGLQLYSVREMLAKDYGGTLKQLSAIGYREVEAAGFYGHSPAEVKDAMKAAGLRCVSSHHPADSLLKSADETISYCKELGVDYVICSSPAIKDPSRLKAISGKSRSEAFTIEDYRWNAELFNGWGRKAKAAGMKFGYHNHTMEFAPKEGVVPLQEMIRLTDPELVTFELDCGWVIIGGGDPVAYLRDYSKRISMLHVKDFKRTTQPDSVLNPPPPAELGRGTTNYKPIFEAAKRGNIQHAFVEQEGYDIPPLEALAIDAEYMKNMKI